MVKNERTNNKQRAAPMKKTILFQIIDGNIKDKTKLWAELKRYISTLKDDWYVWPLPEKKQNKRSVQQNAYMWGVVYKMLSEFTGYTDKEIHQLMGREFLVYQKNNEVFVKSTTELKTTEMEHYLENVRRFAATNEAFRNDEGAGLYIPLPNEPSSFYYEM